MNTKLNIPEKLKVGFQERQDTYSGKLAYITYYKGNDIAKKDSWEGWINKGQDWEPKDMGILELDNRPRSGFVINKSVGGARQSYGWNARNEYARVYDPLGFEFEISYPNLLFILQECNSFKGKGLDGEFIYAWDGKNLVLLPTNCEEYKQSTNFNSLKTKKVGKTDWEEGHIYLTKKVEKVVYLGKLNYYENTNGRTERFGDTQRFHIFRKIECKENGINKYLIEEGFTKIAEKIGDDCVPNYSEFIEEWNSEIFSSSIKEVALIPITDKEKEKLLNKVKEFNCTKTHGDVHLGSEKASPYDIEGLFVELNENMSAIKLYGGVYHKVSYNVGKSFSVKDTAEKNIKKIIESMLTNNSVSAYSLDSMTYDSFNSLKLYRIKFITGNNVEYTLKQDIGYEKCQLRRKK